MAWAMRSAPHVRRSIDVDEPGRTAVPQESPEHAEDLDVHELGTVERELRIGDSPEDSHPRPGSEHQLHDRGGVQESLVWLLSSLCGT